jgi:hypothetical protein
MHKGSATFGANCLEWESYLRCPRAGAEESVKLYCCVALVLMVAPALAAESFETRLSPSPLTDGTRINVTGEGEARVSLDGNKLTVSGDFHGLASGATAAALYDGLGIAIPGPKAFDLTATPSMAGTLSGSVTLTAKQAAALRAGHFYVQIDSRLAPDGNLTGWLLPPHPHLAQDEPVAGPGVMPQFDVKQK